MGITFTFAASDGDIDSIGMPCALCERMWAEFFELHPDTDAQDALWPEIEAHQSSCLSKMHDVNMTSTDAWKVFRLLGLTPEYSGVMDAAELRKLIEDNCTWPTTLEPRMGSRILRLYALAKQAADRQVKVGWS